MSEDKIEFHIGNNDPKEGEHKRYLIETVSDISKAVTIDNIDGFITDLKASLLCYLFAKSVANAESQDLEFNSFEWIDDHKIKS